MIALTVADVARLTGGALVSGDTTSGDPATAITGVVIDTREASAGDLFVAVAGERVDGHDLVARAVAAGAVAVLARRPVELDGVAVPVVVTPLEPAAALAALAREVLARRHALAAEPGATPFDVVAITGSSGKTSTKDLLAAVLATAGPTVAPPGSLNNELGVPLTALRVEPTTRHLVLEMGARGIGHIAALCADTPPRVGVVLNVGSAHLGEFGGPEAVARAKGELVEALPAAGEGLRSGGVAVLNADDHAVTAMAARTTAAVLRFGTGAAGTAAGEELQVRASDTSLDDAGRASFALHAPDGTAPVTLQLHGEHHVANALAAAAAAHALGVGVHAVAAALGAATATSRWRMEVTDRPDGITIVNDAYNANPESMRAALRALTAMRGDAKQRRTWAVLGEMRELGEASTREHDAVGRYAVRLDISRVVAVGAAARPLHLGAMMEGSWGEESVWVPDVESALALLHEQLAPGDIVLVKSSNAVGLHRLGDQLAAEGDQSAAEGGATR